MDVKVVEDTKLFHNALRLYRQKDWDEAEKVLRELLSVHPHTYLYELYLERIAEFRKDPPPAEWDGVFTHEAK
jgi:adenylate cyclase